jgi:hypothetical protein
MNGAYTTYMYCSTAAFRSDSTLSSVSSETVHVRTGQAPYGWKFKVWKILTLIVGLCCVGFITPIGVLQVGGVSDKTVKYGHEFCGTSTKE